MRCRNHVYGRNKDGFTLIEILIVVTILAILAAIVMPQFSSATKLTSENALRDDLRSMRTQILLYNAQHGGTPPGYPGGNELAGATEVAFKMQLTSPTDVHGTIGAMNNSTYRYGPYIISLPANPLNKLKTIRIIGTGAFPTEAAGTDGWLYQPTTLTFASDALGQDEKGTAYIDY